MGYESAAPFFAAAACFGVLLVVLAHTVQRERLLYRSIVSLIAALATLMTTLSYVQLASARQPVLIAAHPELSDKVLARQPACVRQGVVPACSCIGQ